jgi:hypothetical protein
MPALHRVCASWRQFEGAGADVGIAAARIAVVEIVVITGSRFAFQRSDQINVVAKSGHQHDQMDHSSVHDILAGNTFTVRINERAGLHELGDRRAGGCQLKADLRPGH